MFVTQGLGLTCKFDLSIRSILAATIPLGDSGLRDKRQDFGPLDDSFGLNARNNLAETPPSLFEETTVAEVTPESTTITATTREMLLEHRPVPEQRRSSSAYLIYSVFHEAIRQLMQKFQLVMPFSVNFR